MRKPEDRTKIETLVEAVKSLGKGKRFMFHDIKADVTNISTGLHEMKKLELIEVVGSIENPGKGYKMLNIYRATKKLYEYEPKRKKRKPKPLEIIDERVGPDRFEQFKTIYPEFFRAPEIMGKARMVKGAVSCQ